jgi:hypothetical protein
VGDEPLQFAVIRDAELSPIWTLQMDDLRLFQFRNPAIERHYRSGFRTTPKRTISNPVAEVYTAGPYIEVL